MLSPPTSSTTLPVPSDEALRVSAELGDVIHAEIERAGGWVDFSRYMDLALYAPGLGYYSAGSTKFGPAGDFVTAPELSAILGRALASTLDAELPVRDSSTVLEVGAGSGALAAQLLDAWTALGRKVDYWILEPSADLRARQQAALQRFAPRVRWLDRLPAEPFSGAIVANEVVDALPASCFAKGAEGPLAVGVASADGGFRWAERAATAELASAVGALERRLGAPLPLGYRSELRPQLSAWLGALTRSLERGCLLFVDYGFVATEYYHPQRSAGTLICHYRHRAHGNPFLYPGLQDITAWVDFSALAEAAVAAGCTISGFTTQGQYLAACLAAAPGLVASAAMSPREQSALKTLILPGEMGERFKVLLLRKGTGGQPLPGRDFRHRL
jgi:SAM-dependent MidA family methyltransferase